MTEEIQDAATPPAPAAADTPSPGAMIRNARERARLTLEDLATQIKLARSTLDALERDNFDSLLEPVYVRGYYRKCAKVLGIPEKQLIDAYQALVAPKAPSAPSKLRLASGSELGSGARLPMWMSVGVAVLAAILLSLVWSFIKGPPQAPPLPVPVETAPAAPALPVTSSSAAAAPDAAATAAEETKPAAVAAAPVTTPTPSARTVAPAVVIKPAPVPLPPAASASKPEAAPVTAKPATSTAAPLLLEEKSMSLEFSITSWARITDANGKTLLNSLMHAGDKRSVRGAPPFAVFLGNAPGVTAQYEGKPVDLAKYTGDNLTARFSLPEKR